MDIESDDIDIPPEDEFRRGIEAYRENYQNEESEAIYWATLHSVDKVWGHSPAMAQQVLSLLTSWNSTFERYNGKPDRERVVSAIDNHLPTLTDFKSRHICSVNKTENEDIGEVFTDFLKATRGTSKTATSSVGVAKSLHLLAPDFFPPWDSNIAEYILGNSTSKKTKPAEKWEQYWEFCWVVKEEVAQIEGQEYDVLQEFPQASTLKLIDEYNYAKYSEGLV